MKLQILAFGIAKDIFSGTTAEVELSTDASAKMLKEQLEEQYPRLKGLSSYAVAVNDEYAEDNTTIKETDEVAIIPPVSGG